MKKLKKLVMASLASGLLYIPQLLNAEDNFIENGNFREAGKSWEICYKEPELGKVTFERGEAPVESGFARLAPKNSVAPHYLALQQKLEKGLPPGKYTLKAWMRISEDYAAKMPRVSLGWRAVDDPTKASSAAVTMEKDAEPGKWTLCESELEIPEGAGTIYVYIFTYGSMGHADFNGILLEPLQ